MLKNETFSNDAIFRYNDNGNNKTVDKPKIITSGVIYFISLDGTNATSIGCNIGGNTNCIKHIYATHTPHYVA